MTISARSTANLLGAVTVAGAIALYALPPERYRFYPACPIYAYTHILCPGCGATRALAALLRGNLAAAWQYNPLFVSVLPLLLIAAVRMYWSALANGRVEWPQLPKFAIALFFVSGAIFTVARNL
jgi:hypothetical protein